MNNNSCKKDEPKMKNFSEEIHLIVNDKLNLCKDDNLRVKYYGAVTTENL